MSGSYKVLRKAFHVPSAWMQLPPMQYLVNHTYARQDAFTAFVSIAQQLKCLGYDEDHSRMVHDYLRHMIHDLLDKNGEVFLTSDDIRKEPTVLSMLEHFTPDFIIKKSPARHKTILLDVYVGDKPAAEVRDAYLHRLGFFADVCVVTQHDFAKLLPAVLPRRDIDYLYVNYQLFLTEFLYWQACTQFFAPERADSPLYVVGNNRKLQDASEDSLEIKSFEPPGPDQVAAKLRFKADLAEFAARVADQSKI